MNMEVRKALFFLGLQPCKGNKCVYEKLNVNFIGGTAESHRGSGGETVVASRVTEAWKYRTYCRVNHLWENSKGDNWKGKLGQEVRKP